MVRKGRFHLSLTSVSTCANVSAVTSTAAEAMPWRLPLELDDGLFVPAEEDASTRRSLDIALLSIIYWV